MLGSELSFVLFYVLGDGRQPNSRGLKNPPSSTLLHGKINPKDWQVLSLGDAGVLQSFLRVVSSDYGKP